LGGLNYNLIPQTPERIGKREHNQRKNYSNSSYVMTRLMAANIGSIREDRILKLFPVSF
jgi:hypothetical protein